MTVSSKVLARWYQCVGQSLSVGSTLSYAVMSHPGPPLRSRFAFAEKLEGGADLDRVLSSDRATWLPPTDRYLLSAGAAAGRLPETMEVLADRHERQALMQRRTLQSLVYPFVVYHLAVLGFSGQSFVMLGFDAFLATVAAALLPVYAGLILLFRTEGRMSFFWSWLPLLKDYRRYRALSDLSFSLENFLAAGVRMDAAWFGAGMAAQDSKLAAICARIVDGVQSGNPPGDFLAGNVFPREFIDLYRSGEQTGSLDRNLKTLSRNFAEIASEKQAQASFWYPKLVFLVLAAWIGVHVIQVYSEYLKEMERLAS